MRVVIDTNLLIDGAEDDFNYGNRIIDLVIDGKIKAFANRATLRENKLIARRKVKDREYREKLERYFKKVVFTNSTELVNVVAEDKEDNKLVESAVAAGAQYLISSDRHLLKLEEYKGIKIVRPQEFVNIFEDESGSGWKDWAREFIK